MRTELCAEMYLSGKTQICKFLTAREPVEPCLPEWREKHSGIFAWRKKNAQEANMLGNSPMTSLLSKECYLGRLASEAETENKRNYTK